MIRSRTASELHRLGAALLLGGALLGVVGESVAQVSAQDRTTADALFGEAKKLMDRKLYEQACPKFEESYRLDPLAGTLLNLAVCHARQGKTATAWAEFQEARELARVGGRADRVRLADREIKKLEPRLSRLTIDVPAAARVDGLVVERDGGRVGQAAWGTAVPVDPGLVRVVMRAPGHQERSVEVEVAEAEQKSVSLEALEALPAAPPEVVRDPEPAPPVAAVSSSGQRTLGYVLGGVGVVGVGVGTYFGLRAISKEKQSDERCTDAGCDQRGLDLSSEASTAATISNVGFAIGAVGVAAGAYFLVTASSSPTETRARSPRLTAGVGKQGASVVVQGAW
ncbi:MAG: tetratricopeptide repeat protein [Polyangiaceae bacterium]|nr:tetratricopeptide repeat protein [Polyangiaceae bacterium]